MMTSWVFVCKNTRHSEILLCAAQSSAVKLTLEKTSQGRLRLDVSGFPAISKGATIGRHPALRNARAISGASLSSDRQTPEGSLRGMTAGAAQYQLIGARKSSMPEPTFVKAP
jgi:hypothetical protein